MDPFEEPGQRRFVSIPSLMAWLSVCILAAAWGKSLDDQLQAQWSTLGLYGLVASVGLGVLEKGRNVRLKRARHSAIQARTTFGLARITEQGAAREAINAAVRRVTVSAGADMSNSAAHTQRRAKDRRAERRSEHLGRLPMEITVVIDHDDLSCDLSEPFSGTLRDLSAGGISFLHTTPIEGRIVVLTIRLPDGLHLSFVAEALWTDVTAEGFVSGGSILDVGIPDETRSTVDALQPAAVCSM
ncbi:MAG: PilZ domain-containing protein [Pirellulales bacterium]